MLEASEGVGPMSYCVQEWENRIAKDGDGHDNKGPVLRLMTFSFVYVVQCTTGMLRENKIECYCNKLLIW